MKIKDKTTRAMFGLFAIILAIYAFLIEPNRVQTTYHQFAFNENPHKLRVVQLSDLHLRDFGRRERLVVNEVSRLNPDVVLFTGDVIDKADSISVLESFLNATGNVPKLAVLGNWEHWAKVDIISLRRVYESHNTSLLINQVVKYNLRGKRLEVIGLDDYTAGKPAVISSLLPLDNDGVTILIQHSPGMFTDKKQMKKLVHKFDLCLSGHTHAGQITLFGLSLWTPPGSGPFTAGMYATENCPLYVSRGIGTSILPARLGARPEIAVFDF